MKYDGVVVLFKPDNNLNKNIDSYLPYLDKLFVVDNTPNVDLSDKFKKNKKIKYIPLNDNKGIAYALNVGAKEAIKDGADFLLTMDQDSRFKDDSLKKMEDFIEKFKKDNFVGNLIGADYKHLGIVSPFHLTVRTESETRVGVEFPLEVMTSGNLVNLEAYKKVNGFKDWLFIDCVDFDFCLNLRRHKYQIVQLNYCTLNHDLGDTIKINFLGKTMYADNHSAFRRYYITRNRHYLYDMYHKDFPTYCDIEIGRTKKELFKIWFFEKDKIKKTKAIYMGYRDYKRGIKNEEQSK